MNPWYNIVVSQEPSISKYRILVTFVRKIRRDLTMFALIFLCITVSVWGLLGNFSGETNKRQEKKEADRLSQLSFFNLFEFYLTRENRPKMQVRADFLTVENDTNNLLFIRPRGLAYNEKGEIINYKADTGHLTENQNLLTLDNNAEVFNDTSYVHSKKIIHRSKEQQIEARGMVKSYSESEKTEDKIFIDSDYALAFLLKKTSIYKGAVKGKIVRKRVYEENIFFNSDKLSMDLNESKAELEGSVYLTKENFEAWGRRGELFLENYNKSLKYYALYDDVKVNEKIKKGSELILRTATGEMLEGIISDNLVILTGNPKVFQNQDVVKGNQIVLRQDTDVIEVDQAITNFKLK